MSFQPQLAAAGLLSVDAVLRLPAVQALTDEYGRELATDAVRQVLSELRVAIRSGHHRSVAGGLDGEDLTRRVREALERMTAPTLRPVFNLSGTVLHTNLGRAVLPPEALEAVITAASGPSTLEYDLDGGTRGSRNSHLEPWLVRLTGAQAATVVNNNAAAVYLTLETLARDREVPVSRGELVEIGGSFRMPEIMHSAGCHLVEVGTTNRTHRSDYEKAIGSATALLMKVHTSNYEVRGFVKSVSEAELAEVAHAHGLPLVVDLGSGTLLNLERYGLPHEPTPMESLAHGADLVTFSGDKLLGGPQAGIIVGRADLIEKIERNPVYRTMRLDKLTIAALSVVLRLYGQPAELAQRLPTLRFLTRSQEDIRLQAERLRPRVESVLSGMARVETVSCESQVGSGSLPSRTVPSAGLAIRPLERGPALLESLAAAFRRLPIPVIGRVHAGDFYLDLRCLEDEAGFREQLGQLRSHGSLPS